MWTNSLHMQGEWLVVYGSGSWSENEKKDYQFS